MIIWMMMMNMMSVSKLKFLVSKLKFWLYYAIIWCIKIYYDIYENNDNDDDDDDDDDDVDDNDADVYYENEDEQQTEIVPHFIIDKI